MMEKLRRMVPPGFPLRKETNFFITGFIGSFLYSLTFFPRYMDTLSLMFYTENNQKVLDPQAAMPPFSVILEESFVMFYILALAMLGFALYHYLYFYQGSKSIYLMRRLPQKYTLLRQCITLPLCAAVLCMVTVGILYGFYYGFYLWMTPDICLENQKAMISGR